MVATQLSKIYFLALFSLFEDTAFNNKIVPLTLWPVFCLIFLNIILRFGLLNYSWNLFSFLYIISINR